MLETLGLEFEGRPHCGLDDAHNIARILLVLMNEHAPLHINERLTLKDYRTREKALLTSAAAIVQKRTDGMGDLVSFESDLFDLPGLPDLKDFNLTKLSIDLSMCCSFCRLKDFRELLLTAPQSKVLQEMMRMKRKAIVQE